MIERPEYKLNPLWNEAMGLAREAYALAGELSERDPETSRRLRKAAVAVPAQIAGALSTEASEREGHVVAARGALAELSRQAERAREAPEADPRGADGPQGAPPTDACSLAARAEALDRAVLFELGVSPRQAFS